MADEESGSIAARCISFARQGMIAFSYDMVGYNDTVQVDHKFASDPANLLWNISLMGLQTWNSIRALDFLESLPDVDKKRLACTGESGGGTQTFILGAMDDRLAAQAPIVMVSHSMQGGCLCENAPGLRVDYSNMEIAAAPAPRPQVIVAATGDWTKKMMEVEGPAIESVYKLFRAEDKFDYAIFDYPHNYNETTREFVYGSLGKWLLKEKNPERLKEQPYKKEPDAELRVFPDGKLPAGALKEPELIASMKKIYAGQLDEMKPVDPKSLKNWKREMLPAWEHALQLQHVRSGPFTGTMGAHVLSREPDGAQFTLRISEPDQSNNKAKGVLVLLMADNKETLGESLLKSGFTVASFGSEHMSSADQFENYFHTYNRTRAQSKVAEVKVASEFLRKRYPRTEVLLIGTGADAPAALLAAPLVDAVVVDGLEMDEAEDADLLKPAIFFPGMRRVGSLQGIAALAAPNPIFVHNIKSWDHAWLTSLYGGKQARNFRHQTRKASATEILDWARQISDR